MRTVIFWSRTIDRRIVRILGVLSCLAVAALVGAAMPEPVDGRSIVFVDAFITTSLLILVWASFRLIRPKRYGEGWVVAEFLTVPIVWACLVTALGLWFSHIDRILSFAIE